MVDCVGYIVPEAMGHIENGGPRMVSTPWREEPMPFTEAAEYGTRKVITDHSTIGVVVTTDGTIGEIGRQNYVEAEKRIVNELKSLGKPFAIVMNSADPSRDESIRLATEIEKEYGVPVALVNCLELNSEDIKHILEMILMEFPIRQISVDIPLWLCALGDDHPIYLSVKESVLECASGIRKIADVSGAFVSLSENEYIEIGAITEIDLGTGDARLNIRMPQELYYKTLGEMTGFEITGEETLVGLLRELSEMKKKYDKIAKALDAVNENGYGIVTPDLSELTLDEPEIVKQNGGYGVKLKAGGPSIHMIKARIETEINPIVGTEAQSEELVKRMSEEYRDDPSKIWESNIFGKTLHELVRDGLDTKLEHMPPEARERLSETLEKVINEGSGGLICIIL
jgi:stage IV sporulation protein A